MNWIWLLSHATSRSFIWMDVLAWMLASAWWLEGKWNFPSQNCAVVSWVDWQKIMYFPMPVWVTDDYFQIQNRSINCQSKIPGENSLRKKEKPGVFIIPKSLCFEESKHKLNSWAFMFIQFIVLTGNNIRNWLLLVSPPS